MDRQHNGSFARVGYVVSQELVKISSLLPSNKSRSFVVHSLIKCLGLLASSPPECGGQAYGPAEPTLRIVRPRLASVQELCLYHDRDYVEFVLLDGRIGNTSGDGDGDGGGVGVGALASEFGIEDDCPPFVGMGRYVRLVAGSTLCAVDVLKSGEVDVAIAWDGGRHHAQKGRAAGFCYVADCILAILSLKRAFTSTLSRHPGSTSERKTRKPRVMYLDLDLHFSDAVSECFYKSSGSQGNASSQVLTLSIHYTAPGFYPPHPLASLPNPAASTGTSDESTPSNNNNNNMEFDPFTLSLPLKQGASSRTFTRIWPIVERVKDVFNPDYVIVQCGTDGLAGDPHGIWNWSIGAGVGVGSESSESEKGSLDWCVGEVVNKWGVKVLLLGGGGYNSPNTARAWAKLTSVVLKRYLPSDTPIPDHSAFPLYAPSFTLDVPAGNMRDENSEEYLRGVEEVYSVVIERLRERCVGV